MGGSTVPSIFDIKAPTSDTGAEVALALLGVVVAVAIAVVVLAVIQDRRHAAEALEDQPVPLTDSFAQTLRRSTSTLATVVAASPTRVQTFFVRKEYRGLPIGLVVVLFYAVSFGVWWGIVGRDSFLDRSGDAAAAPEDDSGADAAPLLDLDAKRRAFAAYLLDPTDPLTLALFVGGIVAFLAVAAFGRFVARTERKDQAKALDESETARLAVSIFIPTMGVFFLDLVRALMHRCEPMSAAAPVCSVPDQASRLLVIPVFTIVQSVASFSVWLQHVYYNDSAAWAALAMITFIMYGLTVCVFNARTLMLPPDGIPVDIYYVAVLRAILTEIWVFQFIRVALENLAHCVTHSLQHLGSPAHSAPGSPMAASDPASPTARKPEELHEPLLSASSTALSVPEPEVESPRALPDGGSSPTRDSGERLGDGAQSPGPAALHPAAPITPAATVTINEPAAAEARRRRMSSVYHGRRPAMEHSEEGVYLVTEYKVLFSFFLFKEFAALAITHSTSSAPAAVDYTSVVSLVLEGLRSACDLAIIVFAAYRWYTGRATRAHGLEAASGILMIVFAFVLLLAVTVIDVELHLAYWPVLMVNTTRFVALFVLLMLRPVGPRIGADTWLVFSLVVFLWVALSVVVHLIAEGYHHTGSGVLRGVVQEILLFEVLALLLDRFYITAKAEEDDPAPVLRLPKPRLSALRNTVTSAAPLFAALVGLLCRAATFGGGFDGEIAQGLYLAQDLKAVWVIVPAAVHICLIAVTCIAAWWASSHSQPVRSLSFVACWLFLVFAVLFGWVLVAFAKPASFENVVIALLQPLSDTALVLGSLWLWSCIPPRVNRGTRLWRRAGLAAQFVLLAVHVVLGIVPLARVGGQSAAPRSFGLFFALRWIALLLALHELFMYALFTIDPPDPPPAVSTRRAHASGTLLFYGLTACITAPPCFVVVITAFHGENALNDAAGVVATASELAIFAAASVVCAGYTLIHERRDGDALSCAARVVALLEELFVHRFTAHVMAACTNSLVLVGGFVWLAIQNQGLGDALAVAAEFVRVVLFLLFFLHFVPHHVPQVRKRSLVSAAAYLVCSTRLLAFCIRVTEGSQNHAVVAVTGVADVLFTLHVVALGNARYATGSNAKDTESLGVPLQLSGPPPRP